MINPRDGYFVLFKPLTEVETQKKCNVFCGALLHRVGISGDGDLAKTKHRTVQIYLRMHRQRNAV